MSKVTNSHSTHKKCYVRYIAAVPVAASVQVRCLFRCVYSRALELSLQLVVWLTDAREVGKNTARMR